MPPATKRSIDLNKRRDQALLHVSHIGCVAKVLALILGPSGLSPNDVSKSLAYHVEGHKELKSLNLFRASVLHTHETRGPERGNGALASANTAHLNISLSKTCT